MITLEDIYRWADSIAQSQGTASEEEEAIATAIRDARMNSTLPP